MIFSSLLVASKEQKISLSGGFYADIRFDPFYKRWYYNLYENNELVAAGISLTPDSAGLLDITKVSLGVIERNPTKGDYEPYYQLGDILDLIEIQE